MPENRNPQHRIDLRNPLVLDTRELGRRAGSMRTVRFPAPAPDDLGVELIGVPAGSAVDLDLRLESVMEGVLVSGTAAVQLAGECGRCLDTVDDTLTGPIQELFASPGSAPGATAEEGEPARGEGHSRDLEPTLRDAVVLALPLTPLCREDCAGLCAECGERLDDLPEDHAHRAPDVRWSALEGLLDTRTTEEK